jgi:hypothetical protein
MPSAADVVPTKPPARAPDMVTASSLVPASNSLPFMTTSDVIEHVTGSETSKNPATVLVPT